jgi:hypothetical protein
MAELVSRVWLSTAPSLEGPRPRRNRDVRLLRSVSHVSARDGAVGPGRSRVAPLAGEGSPIRGDPACRIGEFVVGTHVAHPLRMAINAFRRIDRWR